MSAPARGPAVQGDWSMFHGDIRRSGAAVNASASKLALAWSYCTGAPISSSPVVHAGIVYIGSLDETLTALDIRSGKMLWQVQADDQFYSTPAIVNGVVYAASLSELYAIDARTGFVHWSEHVETENGKFWSSPAVTHGLVIIGLASNLNEKPKIAGRVLAFDAKTGKVRWRTYTSSRGAPGAGVWSSPAVDEQKGIVYVATGDPDDGVQALALRNGHLLWHWRSIMRDVADTDIGAGPMLYTDRQGKERVVVGGKNGSMYSLDASSGRVLWQTQVGGQVFSSPAFANGTIYALGTTGGRSATVWALDGQSGSRRWHYALATMVYASPVVSGQALYIPIGNGFGPGTGGIEVLNTASGHQIQYMDLRSTTNSSPAVLAAWLFVGAHNGNIYAFTRH
ncbi:MAG: PQQ-binding-like beta-propeller repeat protein [Chloroflexota bacterium]|nr:PQQ-binding-like beta-propeller repeat protein [Chloroflexota bacterium]